MSSSVRSPSNKSFTLACIAGAVAEAIHGVPAEIADQARAHLTDDLRHVLDDFERARLDAPGM
jgi:ADP-ribosylglycohydrolase